MDDSSVQKTWERPWTTEEMRAHCSNWNLAGDAGLLKHLQEFSQNLLQKTHTTEVALDSLLEEMRNTSVDVQNASNALLMLSNSQFVENRVYDDCEEEKDEVEAKPEDKNRDIGEAALIAKVGETIRLGMAVIDTKFDCMEVPASDSEGEEDLESPSREGRDKKSFALVLEPRNPYLARPLPYLIGSKEFMEDDKIGLGDEEEEEDEEEDEDEEMQVSMGQDLVAQGLANDSGSSLGADIAEEGLFDEDELDDRRVPKVPTKQHWESSSSNASDVVEVENNRIRKKQKKNEPHIARRGHEGPFGRNDDEDDIFGKESASEDEFFGEPHAEVQPSLPVKKHPDAKGFAEELAAKLGAVEGVKGSSEPIKHKKNKVENKTEVVKGAKTKSKTPSVSSDYLFGPPKDDWNVNEDEDSIFADNDGMFSSNRGLFDDLNEPALESKPSKFTSSAVLPRLSDKPPPLTKEKEPPMFEGRHGNLFGDEDGDDADMFADILVKRKPPDKAKKSEAKMATGDALKKNTSAPDTSDPSVSPKLKDKKFVDSSDLWLFDDGDQGDPLYRDVSKGSSRRKQEEESKKERQEVQHEEEKKEPAPRKKLHVGAPGYANVVKEMQEKKKALLRDEPEDDDLFSAAKAAPKKVGPTAAPNPFKSEPSKKESQKEPHPSPKPGSLFDDLGDGDDLFTPVTSKASKSFQPNNTDDFLGDDLFASKKSLGASSDKSREKEKASNTKKGGPLAGIDIPSKGLFGGSGSDDDDIFSCSSSIGSRSSGSKIVPNKTGKPFADPSNSLFGDNFGQDVDIFSGTMGKASEKKVVDDLFKDFEDDESHKSLDKKKEGVVSEKNKDAPKIESAKIREDDLFSGIDVFPSQDRKVRNKSEDLFTEVETLPPLEPKERKVSEDLFSEVDPLASSGAKDRKGSEDLFAPTKQVVQEVVKNKKSPLPKKTDILSDEFYDEGDIFSSPFKKGGQIDDIFGDSDDKIDFNVHKKISQMPEIVSSAELDKKKDVTLGNKEDKRKGSSIPFGNSRDSDGEDLFSNKKLSKEASNQEPEKPSVKNEKPKASARKSKDLFTEFGDESDDPIFSPPIGKEEKKSSSIFSDPLARDDDLFSSQKPKVLSRVQLPSEHSPDLFTGKGASDVGEKLVKSDALAKNGTRKTLGMVVTDSKKTDIQPVSVATVSRKSPPRTLNLGKIIPSPKLVHNVPEVGDDFFGSSNAEEDRIVQAWMKGHPPPLRDSKVENTMEDIPGYQDGYIAAKGNVFMDDNSFFGDIPSSALLYSHGKERARIQGRRRPPSRKIKKTPTALPSSQQIPEEEHAASSEPPSTATPVSKGSIEEDSRSQETVEEWSTPEAGLASPPSVPPRSNPLSPSTDEEQDFFDVLPVGRYPPPMGPPELSPFSDTLNPSVRDGMGDNLWDKEDSGLFEDAGDIMGQKEYDSLWDSPVSGIPSSVPPGVGDSIKDQSVASEDLFSDSVPKESAFKSPNESILKGEEGDLFEGLGKYPFKQTTPIASVSKTSVAKEEEKGSRKEEKQASSKKGDMDDLWGEGFTSGSKLQDNLFSKGMESSGTGDFDSLFQGKGDLFGSSKTSSTKGSGKVNLGIAGGKSIGKSLSKLPPKSKDSLFDDDEEDAEDLFSPHPSKPAPSKASAPSKKTSTAKIVKEQKAKSVTVATKSGSSEDLFEDPLMVLKRKD